MWGWASARSSRYVARASLREQTTDIGVHLLEGTLVGSTVHEAPDPLRVDDADRLSPAGWPRQRGGQRYALVHRIPRPRRRASVTPPTLAMMTETRTSAFRSGR